MAVKQSKIVVEPLPTPANSAINFGATVSNVDVEKLSGKY